MRMTPTLQSVATQSTATLTRLDELKDAFCAQGKRIGLSKNGELVIFKGSRFLLHPHQCQRAKDLMTRHHLTTDTPRSLVGSLKFKDLRMDRMPVANLLARLSTCNAQAKVLSTPFATISSLCASTLATPSQSSEARRSAFQDKTLAYADITSNPDDGYETDASQNTLQIREHAAQLRREYEALMRADDAPPALPPKRDRDALIASVEQARKAHGNPAQDHVTSTRPTPMPRTITPEASPRKPPRTFAFDFLPANRPAFSRSASEASSLSDLSDLSDVPESPPFATSRDSLDTVLTLKPLPKTPDEERGEGASRSSGASSILNDLRASGRAKGTLIETLLRTRNLR